MIPIKQTQLHDPPNSIGNCFRAAVASILEVGIDDIPPFEQAMFEGGSDWYQQFVSWLYDQGYGLVTWHVTHPDHCDIYVGPPPGIYVLTTGPSPRNVGVGHCVVYRDGEMVHDPHPSGDGLASSPHTFEYIYSLR